MQKGVSSASLNEDGAVKGLGSWFREVWLFFSNFCFSKFSSVSTVSLFFIYNKKNFTLKK